MKLRSKKFAKFLAALLAIQFIGLLQVDNAKAVATCDSSNFNVVLKSNPVFYFDNGTSITSGYAQFAITNKTGSSVTGYYATLSRTSGTALNLASKESATHTLIDKSTLTNTIASNATVNLYWYLTASSVSASSQTFQVSIYNSANSVICNISKSFTSTASTIAASSNKVNSVTYSSIGAPATNGSSTFTITIKGATGTIGSGPSGAYDVNLNPTTNSNFAAENYRLADTSYTCGGATVNTELYIANACAGNYTAVFTYQYLSSSLPAGSTSDLTPIMQIASGNQMKHTSTPTFTVQSIESAVATGPAPQVTTLSASSVANSTATLNGSVDSGTFTTVKFCYSIASFTSGTLPGTCTANLTPSANVSSNITSLNSSTTYYYEFTGTSGSSNYYGGVQSFTTTAAPAAGVYDTTTAASSVTVDSATLNGNQTGLPSGAVSVSTNSYFIYNTSGSSSSHLDPSQDDTVTATISGGDSTFAANLASLNSGTKYYFELVVVDSNGAEYYGGILDFTTLAITTFDPNGGNLASGNSTDTATATVGTNGLLNKPGTAPTRSGYSFSGWALTTTGSVVTTHTLTGSQTYYAIWTANSSPAPAPVYVPHPPTITSISAAEVCAITPQLVIKGTWLTGATAKVDGVAAQVLATSQTEMTVVLPSAPVGTKTITVTNADGSATTTVKYAFADTPIYVDYVYPETFKDRFFSYIFKAIDAAKYEISGIMPAGLTLNSTTGELSGAPTQEGNFVFQIVASNICASTPLIVYMFVDKAIPTAFTCSVAFNVPSSNNITEAKLTNLRNCLSKTSTLSPKYINPVIFISGGLPAGLNSDQALTHPRYLPILDLIVSMNLNAQIYYGAFNGSTDSVQLNVYWPDPS